MISYNILHSFNGSDGRQPNAPLIADSAGNLYGTTQYGGQPGLGTVFKLTKSMGRYTHTILHEFAGQAQRDGANPYAALVFDSAGDLHGTTVIGGILNDLGTVFTLNTRTAVVVPEGFPSQAAGKNPYGALIFDRAGDRYGTTRDGGTSSNGNIFKLSPSGLTTLFSFPGNRTSAPDGSEPMGALVLDNARNLYGTTRSGGQHGLGTVFRLTPGGVGYTHTVLHHFAGQADGMNPEAPLILDDAGNLYGTAPAGGSNGLGTVFKVPRDPSRVTGFGSAVVLHSFGAGVTGASHPYGALVLDRGDNLYGAARDGGPAPTSAGRVFTLTTDGVGFRYLHDFGGAPDGGQPTASLCLEDRLYNTIIGTVVNGVLVPFVNAFIRFFRFRILSASCTLYGTTTVGGTGGGGSGAGTVFSLEYQVFLLWRRERI